jgi:hypothetical protein
MAGHGGLDGGATQSVVGLMIYVMIPLCRSFALSIVSSLVLLGFAALAISISGVYSALSFLYRLICIYTWLCKRLVDLSGYVNHVHWSSASHRPCRSPAESPGSPILACTATVSVSPSPTRHVRDISSG